MPDTYKILTWDYDLDDWSPDFTGLTKWGIRAALRELFSCGYSHASIVVKAETHNRVAARYSQEVYWQRALYEPEVAPAQRELF